MSDSIFRRPTNLYTSRAVRTEWRRMVPSITPVSREVSLGISVGLSIPILGAVSVGAADL